MCDTEAMHTLGTPWKTKEGATYHAGAPGDGGDLGDGLYDDANSDESGFGAVGSDKSSRRSAMAASVALPAAISALPAPISIGFGKLRIARSRRILRMSRAFLPVSVFC